MTTTDEIRPAAGDVDAPPHKIISGGQTGADLGGLVGARRLAIPTGGVAPRGYKTEKGEQAEALKSYGLIPHPSPNYNARTLTNVQDSDATLIFSKIVASKGTELTINYCEREQKPYCVLSVLDSSDLSKAKEFIHTHKPKILNIAGNRESVSPGIASLVAAFIVSLFGT